MIIWLSIIIASFLSFYFADEGYSERKERVINSLIGTSIIIICVLIFRVILTGGINW